MNWYRVHHGAWNDPKLYIVARNAKSSRPVVVAVWLAVLDCASQAKRRGDVFGFDPESVAFALDIDTEEVTAVVAAMESKGMIGTGRVTRWEDRQYDKPSDVPTATAARKQAQRDRERGGVTEDASRSVTPCHAPSRLAGAPAEQNRPEQNRPEQTDNHPTPQENVAPASVSQAVSGWREGEENLAAVAANLLTGCPDHWEAALIAQYRGARNVSNPAKYLGGIVTRWKQGQNAPTAPPPLKAPPPRDARRPVPGPMTIPVATTSPLRAIAGDSQ